MDSPLGVPLEEAPGPEVLILSDLLVGEHGPRGHSRFLEQTHDRLGASLPRPGPEDPVELTLVSLPLRRCCEPSVVRQAWQPHDCTERPELPVRLDVDGGPLVVLTRV